MDKEKYQGHLITLWGMANVIKKIPVKEMLNAINRTQTIGPFVDPTLYLNKQNALQEDKEMIAAFWEFQKAVWERKV